MFLAGILAVNMVSVYTASASAPEDQSGNALQEAFARHDEVADSLTSFNTEAEARTRSSWYSNLTAEEEQAVIDSMNENFKEAVLKAAYEDLENSEPWDYNSQILSIAAQEEICPQDLLDRYLLASALYADNLSAKLWDELSVYIRRYEEEHPEMLPKEEPYEIYDEDGFAVGYNGVDYAAGSGMDYAAESGMDYADSSYTFDSEDDTALFGVYSAEEAYETADGPLTEPFDDPLPAPVGEPLPQTEETFSTAEYNEIAENPFKSVSVSPLSTFSIDVDTAAYTKVKYDILDGFPLDKDEVKTEELINYFNYDYSADRVSDEPFLISTAYTSCPWQADHRLVRIGIRADDLTEKPDTNFVLVTDVSGSMMILNKLPLALSAYADMLENFDDSDTISLIYYASGNGVVLENVSCGQKEQIYEGLAATLFSAGGGTNGALGLNTAYDMAEKSLIENGVNRVIIATDGDFNIGKTSESQLKEIVEEGRKKGVYLTILGYGSENLKDNKMEVMAENGNGNYHYIGDMADAKKALVQESDSTLIPIADDVKIQVEFNPALIKEYRLIGYESRILNAEDFNNDQVDAGEVGAGKSVTALYEVVLPDGDPEADVQELKYSKTEASGNATDLCNVAVRYKETGSGRTGAASMLVEKPVMAEDFAEIPDENTALAISLAEFGMVLRDSPYKGTATLSSAELIAEAVAAETGNELVQSYVDLIGVLKEHSR